MILRSVRTRVTVGGIAAAALLTACGSSGSSPGTTSASTAPSGDTAPSVSAAAADASTVDGVYQAVEGLTGQQRLDKLVQLAKDQGGSCGYYHAGKQKVDVAAFEKKTGLKINDFQATSERAAEKVLQEKQANQVNSAVMLLSAADIEALAKKGGVAPLKTPALDDVTDKFKGTDWVSPIAIMEMPTYNSDQVKAADLPHTWVDFFTKFNGRKAIEATDWDWFATMVQYLESSQNMTEDQAIKLITDGLRGATTVDGHTLTGNLLASGQYGFVPNFFAHYFDGLKSKGAPIAYDTPTPDMPPMTTTLGMGITAGAKNPACGLAYLEWSMSSEGQAVVDSKGYIPPSKEFTGETLLTKYPFALPDKIVVSGTPAEQKAWQDKFDKMLRDAGASKPVSKS